MEILYGIVSVVIFTAGYVLCYYKGGRYVPKPKHIKKQKLNNGNFAIPNYKDQMSTVAENAKTFKRNGKIEKE